MLTNREKTAQRIPSDSSRVEIYYGEHVKRESIWGSGGFAPEGSRGKAPGRSSQISRLLCNELNA
jgi:hypothetical protein